VSAISSKSEPLPDRSLGRAPGRTLSIGARWALRYTTATILLLFLLTGLLYERIATSLLEGSELKLHQHARSINEIIGRHRDDPAVIAAFVEVEIAASDPDLRLAVELYDADFERTLDLDILAPFTDAPPRWQPQEPGDVLAYHEQRAAPYPYFVLLAQNAQGFTRVAIYEGPVLTELEGIRSVLFPVLAIGILLTGLVGWWLARQSLRPISQITDTALRVGALGSSGWIPTQGTGDELDVLAETLNDMLERIRGATDRMRRFAAQAAHELRTPLGVARTRIEITLQQEQGEAAYRGALENVLADLEVLGEGVNAVLSMARSAVGLDAESLESIELAGLLASVTEFFRPLAEDEGIKMSETPGFASIVRGDRLWLHRLFSNLIDNAIKYSQPGDSIDFAVEEGDGQVWIEIRDTGVGIPDGEQEEIFERFHRAQESTGLGLGLALSMEIVRAHGGTLEYEDRGESLGSVFRVGLPTTLATPTA
jgi:signal transduction histidine kinase